MVLKRGREKKEGARVNIVNCPIKIIYYNVKLLLLLIKLKLNFYKKGESQLKFNFLNEN